MSHPGEKPHISHAKDIAQKYLTKKLPKEANIILILDEEGYVHLSSNFASNHHVLGVLKHMIDHLMSVTSGGSLPDYVLKQEQP